MLNIILTVDYEIFGDGKGNVKKHILKPTNKILNICEKYSVPLTIMFEVNEYEKFIEHESELLNDLGYSPSEEMKNQVSDAYKRGHDIQLHIHPQWIDAEYKDSKWLIKNPNLCITSFSEKKISRIIDKGKKTIKNIISNNNFTVCAMRLTNLPWVEAPVKVLEPMKRNRICYHSLSVSDSPKNNKNGLWKLDEDGYIFEIPIHSMTMPGYRRFSWNRVKTAIYRNIYTNDRVYFNSSSKNKQNKTKITSKIKKLFFAPTALKWDFCKQSCKEMLKSLNAAMEIYDHKNKNVPLVMIGHSKDFFNSTNLDLFLKSVKRKYCDNNLAVFTTITDFKKLHHTVKMK